MVTFRDNTFANPERLINFIREEGARVRPDQKVVFFDDWEQAEDRLAGTKQILRKLVRAGAAGEGGVRLTLVDHREHLDLDQLLRLAQLEHRDVGRGRHVLERREVGIDHLARHADVAHLRPRAEDEDVHDVLERGAGGVERLP